MNKNIAKNKIPQKLLSFFVILALFMSWFSVFAPKVEAGSLALQAILDAVNNDCKNMNRDSQTWDDCETAQGKLAFYAGGDCDLLFEEKASGKWGPRQSQIDKCQAAINSPRVHQKAQSILNSIKSDCNRVDAVQWQICEGMQNSLTIIGCSGTMFEKIPDGTPGEGDDWSWKQAEVDDCQKIIDKIKSSKDTKPGEGKAASVASEGQLDDCNATLDSVLSWIICPIIDLAANTSDYVFGDVIQPLLRDVEVDTQGGAYEAWQGFRILGNIVLVGALLVLVYGAARGQG